jgi:phosphotransferase system enzyme I (PtsI)
MLTKRGVAVSPGVVIGPCLVAGTDSTYVAQRKLSPLKVEAELARLKTAFDQTEKEISENEKLASERLGKQYGAIFGAHIAMLRDPQLLESVHKGITQDFFNAEFACRKVLRNYAKRFRELGNEYFAERANDILDLERRLIQNLQGVKRQDLSSLTSPVLVLARNLTPSETAGLDRRFVLGFATEVGGHTSHTAIIAGALEIPAVVGLGNFLHEINGSETVIIDGNEGLLIVDPDEETLAQYRDSEERMKVVNQNLDKIRNLRSETQDGERIYLMGNIEFPEETEQSLIRGADGIGLYRTEFLYLGRETIPSEEDHYTAYHRVIQAMEGKPVIIRTLDIGADKIPGNYSHLFSPESNPVLGIRSIRLSLMDLDMFRVQLRAILRAAVDADVGIMFPLISSLLELRQAKMTVREVMEDLDEQKIPFNRDIKIGMMVEVPSAAIMADVFAREVDFFSIGTNDLIQYTLAVDRSDPAVAKWFNTGDPAILRLMKMIIDAGKAHHKLVSICGQMSSDPIYVPLLIGLGYRQLSVTPHNIAELKQVIRNLTIRQAEEIARQALSMDLARNVESYLRQELYRICPEIMR